MNSLAWQGCAKTILSLKVILQSRSKIKGDDSRVTASAVGFTDTDGIIYGKVAMDKAEQFPENIIYDAKRMMGKNYS